jgi:hypothetical protein
LHHSTPKQTQKGLHNCPKHAALYRTPGIVVLRDALPQEAAGRGHDHASKEHPHWKPGITHDHLFSRGRVHEPHREHPSIGLHDRAYNPLVHCLYAVTIRFLRPLYEITRVLC